MTRAKRQAHGDLARTVGSAKRLVRIQLPTWRNGAGLAAMFIVFALWLIQAARWGAMAVHTGFSGFLGSNWIEFETFLAAFLCVPGSTACVSFEGRTTAQQGREGAGREAIGS